MRVICMILLLALACSVPARAEDPISRAYGVEFLVRPVQDSAGPRLGFENGGGLRPQREVESLSADKLVELIKDNIDKDVWEGNNKVGLRGGVLIVTAPKATQEKVAALLGRLRAARARTVRLELRVVEGPAAEAQKLLAGGPLLAPAALQALAAKPWTLLRSGRLAAFAGQRAHLASTRHVRYLQDYEIEIGGQSVAADPVVSTLVAGEVTDLRALPDSQGKGLLVECRLSTAAVAQMLRFDTGLEVHGLAPGGGGALAGLEQPELKQRVIRSTFHLPAGGAIVVGASGAASRIRLYVLRQLAATGGARQPVWPEIKARRGLRLFDTRFLTFEPQDFPAPKLRPARPARGAGAIFSGEAEQGVRLTNEMLVEMIKSGVDPDSWEHPRNGIDVVPGGLLVQQTPAVLERVGKLLVRLERARYVSVLVRARFLSVSEGGDWFAERAGGLLDAAGQAELTRRLAGNQVQVLAGLAVTGLPGQQVAASTLLERPYVADYDLQIAQQASGLDPEVRMLKSGAAIEARPVLVGDGKQVLVELRASLAELVELRVVNVTSRVRMQVPTLRVASRRSSLVGQAGGVYLQELSRQTYAVIEVAIARPAGEKKKQEQKK